MIRLACLLLLTTTLSACATASVRHSMGAQLLGSETVSETNYSLNQPMQAFVGESMIRVQEFRRDTWSGAEVRINHDFEITGGFFNRYFRAGETHPFGGQTIVNETEMEFFRIGNYGFVYNEMGQVQPQALNLATFPPIFFLYDFENSGGSGAVRRTTSESSSNIPDGQNYEIVFSGVDGETLRLNYREFTDQDMARQAFFQELTYPASSDTIRFRGMIIEVHEVGADSITFSVVHDTYSR